MIVRATARAIRDIESTAAWWREHRDVGDQVFLVELEEFGRRVVASPDLGQRYGYRRDRLIRRWLLERTGVHAYYTVDVEAVTIHAVWGARRGRGPRL